MHSEGASVLSCKKVIMLLPHWVKNPQFIQKFTIWKSHFSQNSHFENLLIHKNHIFKVWFFTKFTFSKCEFSQNSHFQSMNFHKIHILKVWFFTKFTFFKHQSPGNFWIKSWICPSVLTMKDLITLEKKSKNRPFYGRQNSNGFLRKPQEVASFFIPVWMAWRHTLEMC